MNKLTSILLLLFWLLVPATVFADTGQAPSLSVQMAQLSLQLAVILTATWLGGKAASLLKLPSVVGQILAGVIIGPFALGGLALPGFAEGLFPVASGPIPVSSLVYALSTLAAILLLFMSGLETDLSLFLRYIAKGGIVAIGGVIASFFTGAGLMAWHVGGSIGDPVPLFMGVLSVATSVGITANVLSRKRKIDSPEGTVILSAAVIDDILGIIILAIILGFVAGEPGASSSVLGVVWIAVRAILIWGLATFIGIKFSKQIGKAMKQTFKDPVLLAIMAFGLALLLSGIFELVGLSMIIGAYVMGLTLSNTDISFVVQDKLRTVHDLFVPIFFAVSGMMVDMKTLMNWETLGFGLLFTLVAILAKIIGAGLPSLALNFTLNGALRVGWGMVPRGEVALIIAGIGVSTGLLTESVFGIAMLMTLGTTVIAPPVLSVYLNSKKKVLRKKDEVQDREETTIDFQSLEFAELLVAQFLSFMEQEGFFVNRMDNGEEIYQIRKDSVFITLTVSADGQVRFRSEADDQVFVETAIYESLLRVNDTTAKLRERFRPEDLAARAHKAATNGSANFDFSPYLQRDQVQLQLKSDNKLDAIRELVDLCAPFLTNREEVLADVLERENAMSTGLQNGVALPHAKTDGVRSMHLAIGLAPKGMDYGSLDGKAVNIIALILSPKKGYNSHLQLLSALAGKLSNDMVRNKILDAENELDVLHALEPIRNGKSNGA